MRSSLCLIHVNGLQDNRCLRTYLIRTLCRSKADMILMLYSLLEWPSWRFARTTYCRKESNEWLGENGDNERVKENNLSILDASNIIFDLRLRQVINQVETSAGDWLSRWCCIRAMLSKLCDTLT